MHCTFFSLNFRFLKLQEQLQFQNISNYYSVTYFIKLNNSLIIKIIKDKKCGLIFLVNLNFHIHSKIIYLSVPIIWAGYKVL